MDFKVNREEIASAEVIFDDTQEQIGRAHV